MKKFLKVLLLVIISVACLGGMFACDNGQQQSKEAGIYCKKVKGEETYTVYEYVDDGTTTSLNVETAVKAKYGEDAVVTRIDNNCFVDNGTLTEIIIPNTVTEIKAGAFARMKALTKITLPFVGRYAKADAVIGATGEASDKAVNFERSFGYIFGTEEYDYGASITANYGSGTQNFYMPATLTTVIISPKEAYSIPAYAFASINQISSVTLSENVTAIGEYAFNACNSIQEITIPKSVTTIYANAFKEATSLVKVTFAESTAIASIKDSAFYNCAKLAYVVNLPTTTVLGDSVFAGTLLPNA